MRTTVEVVMAKPKGRPKTSDRDDVAVKFDRSLAQMAKHVAEREKIEGGIAALLSEMCRAQIHKRYAKVLREIQEQGEKG